MSRAGQALRDRTDHYILAEAVALPLRFCTDGYFRVAADTTCRTCGKKVVCVIRCERFRNSFGMIVPSKSPDPTSEQVATTIAVRTEERRTGVESMHRPGCPVGKVRRTGTMMLKGMSRRDH